MQACVLERTCHGELDGADNEVEVSPTATNFDSKGCGYREIEKLASNETVQTSQPSVAELGMSVEAVVLTQTS